MGQMKFKYRRVDVEDEFSHDALTKAEFATFNVSLLGLGDVAQEANTISAIAAVVDLEGFTPFCNQDDPQLVVPEFLNEFLTWLIDSIGKRFTLEEKNGDVILWGQLPFFGKFTGDGVLFLWDTAGDSTPVGMGNIVVSLMDLLRLYEVDFLPKARKAYSKVPSRMRVGIARGNVLSIGGGKDFVGPCINMASRLQKLGSLSFACSRRGFDPRKCFVESVRNILATVEVPIAGLKEKERALIIASDYSDIPQSEKTIFPIVEKHS